jgi:CHAT domain-containing protein
MKFPFLLLCVLFFNVFSSFAQEAELLKIEKYYEKGDYKLGIKLNQTTITKMQEEAGTSKLVLARAYYLLALGCDRNGKFTEYKNNIAKGDELLSKSDKSNLNEYARAVEAQVNAHYSYGDYASAEKGVEALNLLIDKESIKDSSLISHIQMTVARLYFQQGFHVKALTILPNVKSFSEKRLVKKEYLFSQDKGQLVKVSVPKNEQFNRLNQYGSMLNLETNILMDNGRIKEADSLSRYTLEWTKKKVGKRSIAWVEAKAMEARISKIKGAPDDAYKQYKKAAFFLQKTKYGRYKAWSRESLNLYEELIRATSVVGLTSKSKKWLKMYEGRVKRYYTEKSYYMLRINMLSADRRIADEDWRRSISIMDKVLENQEHLPQEHLFRAEVLEKRSSVHEKLFELTPARKDLEEAVVIFSKLYGSAAPNFHMRKLDLANFYVHYTDAFQMADSIYRYSLNEVIRKEMDHHHPKYHGYVYREVEMMILTDRLKEGESVASDLVQESTALFGAPSLRLAGSKERLADVYLEQGQYKLTDKEINESIQMLEALAPTDEVVAQLVRSLQTRARLKLLLGLFGEAERDLSKASKINRRILRSVDNSESVEELALLYMETGRFSDTEYELKEVVKFKSELFGPKHRSLMRPYALLCMLYTITGDFAEAEKSLHTAMEIAENSYGKKSLNYSNILFLQMKLNTAIGDYERALEVGSQALAIQEGVLGRNHIKVAQTLNELALVKYFDKAPFEEVMAFNNESLAIIEQNLDRKNPIYADVLKNRSLLFLEQNRLPEAESALEEAKLIWLEKFGEKDKHIADYFFLKGGIAMKKKQYLEANNYFINSKNIYAYTLSEKHPDYIRALAKSGQMQFILGDIKNALYFSDLAIETYLAFIKDQFPALSEREKSKAWARMREDFEFYNTLAFTQRVAHPELIGKVYNILLATKALLLNATVKVRQRILASGDTALVHLFEQWLTQKELLAQYLGFTPQEIKDNNIDIEKSSNEVDNLERLLSEKSELFKENFEKKNYLDWKEVKKSLGAGEVAVEITRFRYYEKGFTDSVIYAVLAVSPESKANPELRLCYNGEYLESKGINAYRNRLRFDLADTVSSRHYWKPIQDVIGNAKTLYLAPDGVFNQLNLETMMQANGKRVLETHQIVTIGSTRELITARNLANGGGVKPYLGEKWAVLFGNPTFYSSDWEGRKVLSPLNGAEVEINHVQTKLKAAGWNTYFRTQGEAGESQLKSIKSPVLFHIATHGFFMEDIGDKQHSSQFDQVAMQNPLLRSGLVMKNGGEVLAHGGIEAFTNQDGVLTSYEVMNLDFDHTDLVVLSACETGLGDVQLGEGVYGLQRAFFQAGANHVIMSLFKVSDQATQEFMDAFYDLWLQNEDKRKSFLQAKLKMMEKYPDQPIYWGAFVMIGL